jgi:hypothetical protein
MNVNHGPYINSLIASSRQKGALTIFTAIMVLILMTLMLFYATRVGLLEQRVSSNDTRQKLAFQAAEAGLDYAQEYMLAVNLRILSAKAEAAPDGSGAGTFRAGWFSAGNTLWTECPATPGVNHPCGGDLPVGGTGSFYFDDPATTTAGKYDALPLDAALLANLPPNTDVRVTAVICRRTLDDPTCLGAPAVPDPTAPATGADKYSVWLLAYGYSDCNDDNANNVIDIPGECRGNANVAIPMGSIENFKGSPTVPLVSQNSLPGGGTAEVVPNPNGGGVGVPLSIWSNTNPECPPLAPGGDEEGESITVSGAFKTCELQEWFCIDDTTGVVNCDSVPADGKCPGQNASACACTFPGQEPISYRTGGVSVIGMDVLVDAAFPCDLFEFYFGVPSAEYQTIKANATVIDDCSILNTESTGFFWFSGDTCTLGDVGTINNPIMLVSAAETATVINGNAEFFGVLYIADVEDTGTPAYFKPGGGAVVYGAAIVDVIFPPSGYAGTFKVVYSEAALLGAGGAGGLGSLAGGWRDFGLPDIEWNE